MAKKKQEPETGQTPEWKVGDRVVWKGIPLTMLEVRPDGLLHAGSPTLHVMTTHPFDFTRDLDAR